MKTVRDAIEFLRGMEQDLPMKVVLMCHGSEAMLEADVERFGQNEDRPSVGFVVMLPAGSFQLVEREDEGAPALDS
jgi:hypothetical protein